MGRSSRIPKLPDDMVNCILLRLPVTSLLRFKTISKSWCSFINDPKFNNLHLHKSLTHISHKKLLLVTRDACKILSTQASLLSNNSNVISLDPPIQGIFGTEVSYLHVKCSCNGLILIENPVRNIIILWNPAIRKYKVILLPNYGLHYGYWCWKHTFIGFDYDIVNDDYKVLCVQKIIDEVNNRRDYIVDIFSVNNQSWKRIDNFQIPPGYDLFMQKVVSLNGTINMMAISNDDVPDSGNVVNMVLSLFLADEKFVVTPVPETSNGCMLNLCAHDNRVCVYSWIMDGKFSIWSLEEDTRGGGLTWNNILNIPPLTEKPRWFVEEFICVKENGNIVWRTMSLGEEQSHFVEYDVCEHKLVALKMEQVPEMHFSALLYVESLKIPWN